MNRVKCQICGREFLSLIRHLRKAHDISTKEYISIYKSPILSDSTIEKFRKAVSGENNPMYGKGLKGSANPMYGKKHTREWREKHSKDIRGKRNGMFGRSHKKSALRKMSANRMGKGVGVAGKYERTPEIRAKISRGVCDAYRRGDFDSQHSFFKRGYYTSLKTSRRYFYKSGWEFLVMKFLDGHPDVRWWEYEPITLQYKDEKSVIHNNIPDFLICFECGIKEVWEVKPDFKTEEPVFHKKVECLNNFLSNNSHRVRNGLIVGDDWIKQMRESHEEVLSDTN